MTYRYNDDFIMFDNDCSWAELYADKQRCSFVRWRLYEELLSTELTEDEFYFLYRYERRLKRRAAPGEAVSAKTFREMLTKYRVWRDAVPRI